ncbi:hemolysin XhlA family protein [Bacillus sp. 1P06AnD]|uniref:hemolysin XhlA family protein n=1 Tax=Bacillus sp. 1P06AnD TaxID=3132208 RepID=UPI0039A08C30
MGKRGSNPLEADQVVDLWKTSIQKDIDELKKESESARKDIDDLKRTTELHERDIKEIKKSLEEIKDDTKWLRRSITNAIIVAVVAGIVAIIFATMKGGV